MLPDLITTDEYLTATGISVGDADVDQIAWAISVASQTIRDYTDRDFVLTADAVSGTRNFVYQGNNELEIDDAVAVTQVAIAPTTFDTGRTLDPTEWYAVVNKDGVIDHIELYTLFGARGRYSPEMGFTRNLDTLPIIDYPVTLTITATWGWPEIPRNVKQAAVWGAADFMSDPGPYNSESIANYSRSYIGARAASAMVTNALPERALALLEAYNRINV